MIGSSKRRGGILERTKLCESCGDAYAKAGNEQWSRWEKRRFCSLRCWWDVRPNWNAHSLNNLHHATEGSSYESK